MNFCDIFFTEFIDDNTDAQTLIHSEKVTENPNAHSTTQQSEQSKKTIQFFVLSK